MGTKLNDKEIRGLIQKHPNTITFDHCSRCNGIEEGGSMDSKDPDDNSADLICKECTEVIEMNAEADWRKNVHDANLGQTNFAMGGVTLTGSINSFKAIVMDLDSAIDESGGEYPNYISDFVFAVEAEYQTYYGLDQDCWEAVHHTYEEYKKAPKAN